MKFVADRNMALFSTVAVQMANIAYGIVLPRAIILNYGSDMNGVLAAATQIVGLMVVLEAGLSAASIRQLYGPLINHHTTVVDRILASVKKYYLHVAGLCLGVGLVGAFTYSFLVRSSIPPGFVFAICALVCIPPIIDFALTTKYLVFYVAAEKLVMYQSAQFATTFLKTCWIAVAAGQTLDARVLVGGLLLAPLMKWILLFGAFRREPFAFATADSWIQIEQRWAVFGHQLLALPIYNGPILAVGILVGTVAASVFSVNSLIFGTTYGFAAILLNQVVSPRLGRLSLAGRFGEERQVFAKTTSLIAFLGLAVVACTLSLLESFLALYLPSADTQYYKPGVALLFGCWTLLGLMKLSHQASINAEGRFASTVKLSAFELGTFVIVFAVLLPWDVVGGVLVALVASTGFKLLALMKYGHTQVRPLPGQAVLAQLIVVVCFGSMSVIGFPSVAAGNLAEWALHAVGLTLAWGSAAVVGHLVLANLWHRVNVYMLGSRR